MSEDSKRNGGGGSLIIGPLTHLWANHLRNRFIYN